MPLTDAEQAKLQALYDRRERLIALQTRVGNQLPSISIEVQDHQRPPTGTDWVGWCLRAGRRAGKSYACAAFVADYVRKIPIADARMRLIAPTFADAVESCIKGPSGLLALDSLVTWHPSAPGGAVLRWPNGAEMIVMGTHAPGDVDRLRATGGRSLDWWEEAAANPQLEDAFAQAELGRNLGRRLWIASTTPRPLQMLKDWEEDPEVVVTHAITHDNKYLSQAYLDRMDKRFKGTRYYKQEILGEIIDEIEGAIWSQKDIDRSFAVRPERGFFIKIVVGVDPAAGSGTTGIVVAGLGRDGHIYVLEDLSLTDVQPNEWAQQAASAARRWDALVVAERNHGQRMVEHVMRTTDPSLPFTTVWASDGKTVRAEPIAILWEAEEQIAHMCPEEDGDLAALIDQLLIWDGSFSPDRLDAMVWAATYLRGKAGHTGRVSSPVNRAPIPKRATVARRYT